VNVGTTVVSEAKTLAEHAFNNGADAIATVPPVRVVSS
jgi:dihydrodipicolinate synthase/N-acetylneuraminate lyase